MADAKRWLMDRAWAAVMAAAVLVALSGLASCGNGGEPARSTEPSDAAVVGETVPLEINGRVFHLELALDHASRTQGLSDRKSIADDGGMLFVFPYPQKTQFVMRRCYVPIDLIFVDADGYIDSLHAMEVIEPIGGARWKNPTSGYSTAGRVLYAIELRGGMIEQLGLRRGEKLVFPEKVLQLKGQ